MKKKEEAVVRMRTTVYINPLLHKELHVSAIRQGRSVGECFEEALLDFIKKYEKETNKPKV